MSFLYLTQVFEWEAIAFSAYSTYFIILSAVGEYSDKLNYFPPP